MQLGAKGRMPKRDEIKFPFGPANTTKAPGALGEDEWQQRRNCTAKHGDVRLSSRYRLFQARRLTTAVLGTGLQFNKTGSDLLYVIQVDNINDVLQAINTDRLLDGDGSSTANWQLIIPTTGLDGQETWRSWQHMARLFWISDTTGEVYYLEPNATGDMVWFRLQKVANIGNYGTIVAKDGSTSYPYAVSTFVANAGTFTVLEGTVASQFVDATGLNVTANNVASGDYPYEFGYVYTTPQDWSGADYVSVPWEWVSGGITGTFFGINDNANTTQRVKVRVDGSGDFTTVPIKTVGADVTEKRRRFWIDLTGIPLADRARIKEIRVRIVIHRDGPNGWRMGNVTLGRRNLLWQSSADTFNGGSVDESARYLVRYRSADGFVKSQAIDLRLPPSKWWGTSPGDALPTMGSTALLSMTVAGAPWGTDSVIEVWRRVKERGTGMSERFYKLTELGNAGSPSYEDSFSDSALLTSGLPYSESFDTTGFLPYIGSGVSLMSAGCSWKGANVLFDREGNVYFSRVKGFADFLWPETPLPLNEDDDGRPVVLPVTVDQLPVIAAVGIEILYMFSATGVYAMSTPLGPAASSYPRRLPGQAGLMARKGIAPYEGGALYARRDGLYWLRVPQGFAGVASEVEAREVTVNQRGSWTWLLGSSPSTVICCTFQREIWCFNESRALFRDPDLGEWIEIEWAGGALVVGAHPTQEGLALALSTGAMGVIGAFEKDGATSVDGKTTGGTAPTWTTKTRRIQVPLHATAVEAELAGTSLAVTVTPVSQLGTGTAISFNGTKTRLPIEQWPPIGGNWIELTVSGNATSRLTRLALGVAERSAR